MPDERGDAVRGGEHWDDTDLAAAARHYGAGRGWDWSVTKLIVQYMVRLPGGAVRALGGMALFGLPFAVLAIARQSVSQVPLVTRPLVFGWVWLALAPSLVLGARGTLLTFLRRTLSRLPAAEGERYARSCLQRFYSRRHFCWSLPLAVGFAVPGYFDAAARGLQGLDVWLTVLFLAASGLVAGVGFWGVSAISAMVEELRDLPLAVDAFHPDRFGGLKYTGSFLVAGLALFYSGSLFLPYGIALLTRFSAAGVAGVFAHAVVGLFIGLGMVVFLHCLAVIRTIVFEAKVRAERDSEEVLKRLLGECVVQDSGAGLADVLRPWVYHSTYHSQIGQMRDYPFEASSLLQLAGSVLIPIVVLVLDKMFR